MPCLLVATNIFNEIHSYIGEKYSLNLNSSSGWLAGGLPLPPSFPCSVPYYYSYLCLLAPSTQHPLVWGLAGIILLVFSFLCLMATFV